jgi:hypothetical protein
MDKILTRKLFKDKYLQTVSKKVSHFKDGGLASLKNQLEQYAPKGEFLAYINKKEANVLKALGGSGKIIKETGIPSFQQTDERVDYSKDDSSTIANEIITGLQGSTDPRKVQELITNKDIYPIYSSGERQTMLLAPIISELLTGTRQPGQSQLGAVATGVGKAVPKVVETSMMMKKLENERLGDIAKLAKTTGTVTSPLQKAIAGKEANFYADTMESARNASAAFGDLDIIEKMVQNPNLTVGQFGPLATRVATFAQGVGLKGTADEIQNLKAEAILKNVGGNIVMDSFSKFKGPISDADREFLTGINPSSKMTKEQILGIIEVKRRAAERNKEYANLMQQWVSTNPNLPTLSSKDPKTGKSFYDVSDEYIKKNPIVNKEFEKKLEDVKPKSVYSQNIKNYKGQDYYLNESDGQWYKINKR